MRGVLLLIILAVGPLLVALEYATGKETTTLDEATNRSVKIEKYVDKVNGVVCYWNKRHPAEIDCVKVTNTSKRHAQ